MLFVSVRLSESSRRAIMCPRLCLQSFYPNKILVLPWSRPHRSDPSFVLFRRAQRRSLHDHDDRPIAVLHSLFPPRNLPPLVIIIHVPSILGTPPPPSPYQKHSPPAPLFLCQAVCQQSRVEFVAMLVAGSVRSTINYVSTRIVRFVIRQKRINRTPQEYPPKNIVTS